MLVKYLTGTQKQYEEFLEAGNIIPTYFYYIDRKDLYLGTIKLSNKEDIILAIDELKKSNYFATTEELEKVKNILVNYYTKTDIDIFLEDIQNNFNISIEELNTKKLDKTGGTITGNLSIQGDLSVAGKVYSKDVETLLVEDNVIVTNSKGINIDTDLSGFVIRKDESVAYGIMYDNTRNGVAVGEGKLDENNKFTYGHYDAEGNFIEDLHEGQLLATRKEDIINNRIVVWDAENYTLKDGGCGVYDILGRIDVADAAIVAVSKEVENKQDKLTFDSTPTAGSNNPVTSDGIKKAIDNIEIGSGVDLPLSKGSGGYGAFQQTNGNNASGAGSIALGANTISAGNYGFTRGNWTKNTAPFGETAGYGNLNTGVDGYCGGDSSRNMATAGFVHGYYLNTDGTFEEGMEDSDLNKAIPNGQAVFGSLNARNNDALMIVGNGVGNDSTSPLYGRHNAFEVLKDGRAKVQTPGIEDNDVATIKNLKDNGIIKEIPLSITISASGYFASADLSVPLQYFNGVKYYSANDGEKVKVTNPNDIAYAPALSAGGGNTSTKISLYGVETLSSNMPTNADAFMTNKQESEIWKASAGMILYNITTLSQDNASILSKYGTLHLTVKNILANTFSNYNQPVINLNAENIYAYALRDNLNITEINFGKNLKSLDSYAFSGCANLQKLSFESATPPSNFTFYSFNFLNLVEVKVPVGSEEAYAKIFGASKIKSYLINNFTKKEELENYYTKDQINTQNEAFAKITENNTFTGENHFKDIVVEGNIIQQGEAYETHAEKVFTKDDYIIMRDGAAAGLGEGEYTGFQATKYDGENDGRLVFDNTGTARVGDVGDEQPLATRAETSELTDNHLLKWNSNTYKLEDSGIAANDVASKGDVSVAMAICEEMQTSIDNFQTAFGNTLLSLQAKALDHDDKLNKIELYQSATTISIDKNNVNTYLEFSTMEAFGIELLKGKPGVDVRNKIFNITPLLLQIANREVGAYLDIIINGVDVTPMKCVIKKDDTYNFTNPVKITFQNALGYAKSFVVRKIDNTLELASSITLSGTEKSFTEFNLNGEVTGCFFSN